jgi:tetratricopeptide (TPR) repeat protein
MTNRSVLVTRAGLTALALAFGGSHAGSALAASDGGSSGSGSSSEVQCRKGLVYDKAKGMCVQAQSQLMDDEQLYAYGRSLALAGDYDEALETLAAIGDQNDAMVLTMIGYSKRKLGHVGDGIAFYHKALAIDPDNVNTREYLGEGYVSIGRTDLAIAELEKIENVCGVDCEQYVELASFIAGRDIDWRE